MDFVFLVNCSLEGQGETYREEKSEAMDYKMQAMLETNYKASLSCFIVFLPLISIKPIKTDKGNKLGIWSDFMLHLTNQCLLAKLL